MRLRPVRLRVWKLYGICNDRGDCQLLDFLEGLEGVLAKNSKRMRDLLGRVAETGPPRNTDVSHDVEKGRGIWEFINGDLRVYWFYDEGKLIICSHGAVKATRKTPKEDIERACSAFDAYQSAKAKGTLSFEKEEENES